MTMQSEFFSHDGYPLSRLAEAAPCVAGLKKAKPKKGCNLKSRTENFKRGPLKVPQRFSDS